MRVPKVIIAPDSFKHSIDAFSISRIISEELNASVKCNIEILPIGDGGDGTAELVAKTLGARRQEFNTYDPLKRDILSPAWLKDNMAIIEMADVSGIRLLSDYERDPIHASSGGLGILIKCLINKDIQHVILCVGGSATIDMGLGALIELGIRFLSSDGKEIQDVDVSDFSSIKDIDVSGIDYLKDIKIDILCDVENPLLGKNGAIRVYGSQKGVLANEMDELVENHSHLVEVIYNKTGKNISDIKYSGAAGGIAAGFYALLGSNLYKGADYIMDLLDFDSRVKDCDILITGEGRMDFQTQFGKAPFVVATRAREYCKRIIALNGQTDYLPPIFDKSFSLSDYSESLEASIANPTEYLKLIAKDISNYINKVIY